MGVAVLLGKLMYRFLMDLIRGEQVYLPPKLPNEQASMDQLEHILQIQSKTRYHLSVFYQYLLPYRFFLIVCLFIKFFSIVSINCAYYFWVTTQSELIRLGNIFDCSHVTRICYSRVRIGNDVILFTASYRS